MTFVLTQDAADRPKRTIEAAELFHRNAPMIALTCEVASESEVVVAGVDRYLTFSGAWTMPAQDLAGRLPELEDAGWSLVFSPGATLGEIEERSLRVARLAFARWETIRRWASRHPGQGDDGDR